MKITVLLHDCAVDGETGFAATCAEFPEANGQGETQEKCIDDLKFSVADILAYRREQAAKFLLQGARLEMVLA